MKTSTMFLNDVTVIDLAVIYPDGHLSGMSVRPTFWVQGKVDDAEGVVVDFSTVKKKIKALIDHQEWGYDHKLCIGLEAQQYVKFDGDWALIETEEFEARVPRNAIKMCSVAKDLADVDAFASELEQFLETKMKEEFGFDLEFSVQCDFRMSLVDDDAPTAKFCYTHGLKSSTSWGCQNIAHGHYSFAQLLQVPVNEEENLDTKIANYTAALSLCEEIEQHFGDAVFIYRENIVSETEESITVSYTTERGEFWAKYRRNYNRLIVLETETTIEFLVDEIGRVFGSRIAELNYNCVAVSEGLTKGAVYYIEDEEGTYSDAEPQAEVAEG